MALFKKGVRLCAARKQAYPWYGSHSPATALLKRYVNSQEETRLSSHHSAGK